MPRSIVQILLSIVFVMLYANLYSNSVTTIVTVQKLDSDDSITYKKVKDIAIEQVVVTGQYKPQSLAKSVYNVRTITQEQIKSRAATNIQQLLITQPGIRFSSDLTLGISDIELMGMSGRNVKILLDGYPMLDRSDTRESLNQIDVNLVERIEIVEGPMSVVYGSDALAGVINIITKYPTQKTYSIQARIQEETVGKEYKFNNGKGSHQKSVGFNWKHNNIYGDINVSVNQFGGWNVPSKIAFLDEVNATTNKWKPKDQYLGNIKLGYKSDKFHIWYRGLAAIEDINSRYGINPSTYLAKLQTYNTKRYTHQINSNWQFSEQIIFELSAAYTDLARKTKTTIYDYHSNTSYLSEAQGEQDLAEFGSLFFRPTAQHTFHQNLSFQYGLEINRDKGNGARIKGRPTINDFAAFASAEYKPISMLTLRPGIRFIKNSVYSAPKFVPALNAKIDVFKNLDLRLSYAKGYRAPALRELYFDFVDASHAIIGNENLLAETSNSWNASATWNHMYANNRFQRITLSGFYNLFNDRIDYAIDANNASITTLLNIDKYKTAGLTIDNHMQCGNLKSTVGLSYVGRYNRLSENKPEVSIFSWTPEVFAEGSYLFEKYKTSVHLFLKWSGKRPSYQISYKDTGTAQLIKLDGMTFADCILTQPLFKALALNIGVKNLFNVTNLNSSQPISSGAHSSSSGVNTSYGRSFVVGMTYNWTK